jgi:hypothetical protein
VGHDTTLFLYAEGAFDGNVPPYSLPARYDADPRDSEAV